MRGLCFFLALAALPFFFGCGTCFWDINEYYCSLQTNCTECVADDLCTWCLESDGTESCVYTTNTSICWSNDTCVAPYAFCDRFTDCATCNSNPKCSWLILGCVVTSEANSSDPNLGDCAADIPNFDNLVIGERRLEQVASIETNTSVLVLLETSNSSMLGGEGLDTSISVMRFKHLSPGTAGNALEDGGLEFEIVYSRKNYSLDELIEVAQYDFVSANATSYTVSFTVPYLIEYVIGDQDYYSNNSMAPFAATIPLDFDESQPTITLESDGSVILTFVDTSGALTVNFTLTGTHTLSEGGFQVTPFCAKQNMLIDMSSHSWTNATHSTIAIPFLLRSNNSDIVSSAFHLAEHSTVVTIDDGAVVMRFKDIVNGTAGESDDVYGVELYVAPYSLSSAAENTKAAIFYYSIVDPFTTAAFPLLWDPLIGLDRDIVNMKLFGDQSGASTSQSRSVYSYSDESFLEKFLGHLPFILFICIAIICCAVAAGFVILVVVGIHRFHVARVNKRDRIVPLDGELESESPYSEMDEMYEEDSDSEMAPEAVPSSTLPKNVEEEEVNSDFEEEFGEPEHMNIVVPMPKIDIGDGYNL